VTRWALTAAVFAVAVAVRALPWPLVFEPERVIPFGNDAYYHLRRILYSLSEFPAVLSFDAYINFPHGAKPIWTPLFDWAVALAALPFASPEDPAALWRFAVWVPPLLGGCTVLVLMALARRHFGAAEAWLCGVLLAVSSGHFWYSQLGFVDHHAAVALLATLALAAAMALASDDDATRVPWRAGCGFGLASAGALLLWPGALLHVGLLQLVLLIQLPLRRDRTRAIATAWSLALGHALALAVVAPVTWSATWPQWSAFSPVVLTRFQPWLFGALAAHAGLCAALWRREHAGGTAARRLASGLAVGVALVTASALTWPGLLEGAEDAWHWFARRETFQRTVAESRPLFLDPNGRFHLATASGRLSWFVFLAPFAALWIARSAWRKRRGAATAVLLFWGAGLLAATLFQRRFFNTSAVAVAALLALTLCHAWRALPQPWRATRSRRAGLSLAFALVVVLLLAPSIGGYRHYALNQAAAWSGAKQRLSQEEIEKRVALDTAEWIAAHTPATSGWLGGDAAPEYGIMAPWPLGHILESVARRPTVVTNFGDDLGPENFRLMRRYYQAGESEAAVLLDRLGVRYVVAQRGQRFLGGSEPGPGSMHHSLWVLDGSSWRKAEGDRVRVPALSRHRLLFESRPIHPDNAAARPAFKVFEFVPGARVVGRGRPGSRIRVTLPLRTNLQRRLRYETEVNVGPRGTYRIRLPYATVGEPPSVKVPRDYQLECDGTLATLRVPEAAVRDGLALQGPELCRSAESPADV
jgi:dolichyl-diphosphooligosaccharide--protein glycosyltransferase